ncbi:hypothetical protein ACWDBO_54495 [Streptomyces mirabilis]|uniref:hypothetical protein n=1 Tax=Streptomyces mirabilis TaxID=68239 RepID=UPI00331BA330
MPAFCKDRQEADERMLAYAEQTDFDQAWFTPEQWNTVLGIACDKRFGIKEAENALSAHMGEIRASAARARRQAAITADPFPPLLPAGAPVAANILGQLIDAYIAGQRMNLGHGTKMTRAAYALVRTQWTAVAALAPAHSIFGHFIAHLPQDKAALGKANVGGTKDTRKVQGDLLVTIGGVDFNMHIDITD